MQDIQCQNGSMAHAGTEDDTSALAVVLDVGPSWARHGTSMLETAVEQLMIFLNSYSLFAASNQLTVLAANTCVVEVVWPALGEGGSDDVIFSPCDPHSLRAAMVKCVTSLAKRDELEVRRLQSTKREEETTEEDEAPMLPAALSIALCRLHRAARIHPRLQPRVLILHASPDAPSQHLAVMNCIFGAQKLGTLIDAVVLGETSESMLLQQAAHLTGGVYWRPDEKAQRGLAQFLITCCLPDRHMRQFVSAPPQGELETRALCYLTKQPLDIGYACSVCLSVFHHDKLPSCPVCGTRFNSPMLVGQHQRKRVKRATPEAGASAAPTSTAGSKAADMLPPPPPGQMAAWQLESR